MAQVALLHTEINSGFRLSPRIGINSAGERKWTCRQITCTHTDSVIPNIKNTEPSIATTGIVSADYSLVVRVMDR